MEKQSRTAEPPSRSETFAHLTLDALRSYRKALTQEEGRVSYWRRILQARLDMVRASDRSLASMDNLRPVLTAARVGGGRTSLIDILAIEEIPPLPDLEALWDRHPVADDPEHNAELVEQLVKAEGQLSAYRTALHQRIQGATSELIARYREEPALCLSALPLQRKRRVSNG
ncbi:MAG TPA: hypothetical protein VEZ46_13830 [Mycobacteriales bacterium]|nr:hypothetical protein [Mycobacteriales bacterium]